jgi:hypothetical protein
MILEKHKKAETAERPQHKRKNRFLENRENLQQPTRLHKSAVNGGGTTYLQQISITIIYAFSAEVDHFRKEKLIYVTLLLWADAKKSASADFFV